MKMSVIMNCMIPLLCHFMYKKDITNSTDFLLEAYDPILHLYPDVDIYNKIYETAISNIQRNVKRNQVIWNMQDIRGINPSIHSLQSINNILVNIFPKYTYGPDSNLIHMNYKSILKNTEYQITDIGYEYSFVSLSSSKRDEDLNSDFDRFESFLQKQDSGLLLQAQVAADDAMNTIEMMYGPFSDEEVTFYKNRLSEDTKNVINSFQKDMITNLFLKYFGDVNSLNCINYDQYVKLIIAAKRILEASGLVVLPYIVSSKVVRLATRKTINKKEFTKIESSSMWAAIKDKYRNEKIEKHIFGLLAVILLSDFEIIDPYDPELDRQRISVIPELIGVEIQMFVSMI